MLNIGKYNKNVDIKFIAFYYFIYRTLYWSFQYIISLTLFLKFFKQFFPQSEPSTPFTTNVIYKGYLDDPSNTDNAWREVEVWNFHFDKGGDIYLKFKDVSQLCRQVYIIFFFISIYFYTQCK